MSWGTLDDSYVESEQQAVDSISTGKFYKAKQNDNILRILPPWGPHVKWPFKWVWQHSYVDSEGNRKMFVCPRTNITKDNPKQPCLTCDYVYPRLKRSDSEDQELAAELRPKVAVMCNIIDRGNTKAGAQIWRMSSTKLYPQILSALRDPDYGDITNPRTGHDVKLTRVGELLDTKYSLMMKPKKTSIDLSEVEPHDLDVEYVAATREEQIKILEKAYGLTGLDEIDVSDTADDISESEAGLDDEMRAAIAADNAGENSIDPAEAEEDEDEEDEAPPVKEKTSEKQAKAGRAKKGAKKSKSRVALELPVGLSKAKKPGILGLLIKKSACFGKIFDTDNDVCEACEGMIKCAIAMPASSDD